VEGEPRSETMAKSMIGYLVGYKASNIVKAWILELQQRKIVVEVRDADFGENKLMIQ
jgi:hypothetical protein